MAYGSILAWFWWFWVLILLSWVWIVEAFVGDGVGPFPLCLEVNGMSVPVINLCGYSIHGVDSLHEWNGDSS